MAHITDNFALKSKVMEDGFLIFAAILFESAARYFLIAGIAFLIFYNLFSDKFRLQKIQKRAAKRKDFIREIVHSASSTLIFAIIAFLLLATPLRDYTQAYSEVGDYPIWWIGASLALSLIIHDTYFYWMHRLMHHPKIYKHAHLVHHKSINPTPFASYSFHWLEAIGEGLVLVPLLFLLPMHDLTVLLFTASSFVINVYGHLGYEIMPKFVRKTAIFSIINTSTHHNLHHSRFNGNYGLYFRFWDRIMGTEIPEYVEIYDKLRMKREPEASFK